MNIVLLDYIANNHLKLPVLWCQGHCICLECVTSCVRDPVGSNTKDYKIVCVASPLSTQH